MKPSSRAKSESYPNGAERVDAIKKALQEGSYETDSTKVANILIIHLLNHSKRFYRSYVKDHYTLNKFFAVH
jgi:hypothetical protein